MTTQNALSADVQAELNRRHKSTKTTVLSLLVAVILLCVLAFLSKRFVTPTSNPSALDGVLRVSVVILGLGAIALRRTRFAKMRLQDIGGLQGPTGLLITLQRTTQFVAFIGISIALIGFVTTVLTGIAGYTYLAGVVALAVLLYGYPVRRAWEQAVRRYSSSENKADS